VRSEDLSVGGCQAVEFIRALRVQLLQMTRQLDVADTLLDERRKFTGWTTTRHGNFRNLTSD
jgi:hypothetical protein